MRLRSHARRRPRLVGELLVVLVLLRVYDHARAAAEVRQDAAVRHGEALLQLESWLHMDVERAANLWLAGQHLLSLGAVYVYQFAHVSVTLVVLAWCWLRRPDLYRPARNALIVINVVGLLVFLAVPVAPPRLLPDGGFVDAVAQAGFGVLHGSRHADQYGAMPSLHLAWATWSAVVLSRMWRSRTGLALFALYPLLVAVVVVLTGNHYILDAVVGVAVALAALRATAPQTVAALREAVSATPRGVWKRGPEELSLTHAMTTKETA